MKHKIVNLSKCKKCGLVFLEKIPSERALKQYYQDEFYDKEKSERFSQLFETTLKLLRYLRIAAIKKFCIKPGKMVEIGFSRGTTMKLLKSKGWKTFGTQVSINSYNNAKKNGLDVFLGEFTSAKIKKQSIDLVTFWHVLEHVRNPDTYLKQANKILKKNGKLIVEVPNIKSPVARICREKWLGLDLPRHLYHFSNRSLSYALEKNGFKIIKRKYFSIDQAVFSVFQSILNLFNRKNNIFFDIMKKNKKVGFFLNIYNWGLAFIFSFPSIFVAFILGIFNIGDIIQFYCVKVKDIVN